MARLYSNRERSYDLGVLPDDSLQALGAFLSSALGLTIDSCL